jgi:predicted ester cyclase
VFVDANAVIEEIVADDEKVTTRWLFKGTQTGEWNGIAPTGNAYE